MELHNHEAETVALPAGCPPAAMLERVANYVEKSVAAITITSPTMYSAAAIELQELQGKLDKLVDQRMTITRPLDAAKQAAMNLFRSPVERCTTAIAALKSSMLTYQQQESQRQIAAQRAVQEAHRLEQVRVQQKVLAEHEEQRRRERELTDARQKQIDAERAALAAAAAGDKAAEEEAASAALAQQQEQARIASEAQAADAAAQVTQQLAMVMTAPVVESNVPKVKGISTSAVWTAELVSDSDETKLQLLRFVLENPQYVGFIDINMKPIIQQAKSLQAKCQIPGIRAFPQERLSSRRRT